MTRGVDPDPAAPSAALRSLAGLVRAGLPFVAAVRAWPDESPETLRPVLSAVAARVRLGDAPEEALAALGPSLGGDAATLAAIARLHAVSGCDAARLLEAAARAAERRAFLATTASGATAGAKLSGRIVAGLPLLFLPLVPAVGVSLFDRRGSLLLLAGVSLLLTGGWWIARLLPRPPEPDGVAWLAAFVAAGFEAGVAVHDAIRVCSQTIPSLGADLAACARRVRLGASWSSALELSPDDGLRAVGAVFGRAERMGIPIAQSLDAFAARRSEEAEAAFDKAARRAPVLMVLPLTICILPAYVVLAVGPLLRGIGSA